jgi:hypothetical protein
MNSKCYKKSTALKGGVLNPTANKKSFEEMVGSRKPFGIPANVNVKVNEFANAIKIFAYPQNGYILTKEEIAFIESMIRPMEMEE